MFKKLYNFLFPVKTPIEIGQIWLGPEGPWLSEKPQYYKISDMTRDGKFVYLIKVFRKDGKENIPLIRSGSYILQPSVSELRRNYSLTDYKCEDFI